MDQSKPNPALKELGVLVGGWEMDTTLFSGAQGTLKVTFEWQLGGAVLVEDMSGNATWIIGRDESVASYSVLYFDARGVSRIYEMTLEDGVWKIWRDAPGFSQRFTGIFSDDRNSIAARWEICTDGSNWEHDFDVTYKRIRS